jgi:hypothetical protein
MVHEILPTFKLIRLSVIIKIAQDKNASAFTTIHVSLILQVNFNNIIEKHALVKPFKARIVRIKFPANDDEMPYLKVELHGVITEKPSGANYFFNSFIL